jgi:drug/metabolite transporter (DMT)-like permease
LVTVSLQYSLQFWGQQFIASGLSSVITATIPVFTAIYAHRRLANERMSFFGVGGILLGLVGVGIIFSDQLSSEGVMAFYGSTALVLAAAVTSRAQVWVKESGQGVDPLVLTCGSFAVGCIPLLIGGSLLEGSLFHLEWTARGVGVVLYLAVVGSALAFGIMYWLFRHMAITKIMSVGFVNPLVALFIGWIYFDEQLTLRAAAGGTAVLIGVAMVLKAGPSLKLEKD